jgi:hypothetical protein
MLLRALFAMLVGSDGDVLRSVVLGEVRTAQGDGRRADSEEGRDRFLRERREPAGADEAEAERASDHRAGDSRALKRKLSGR